MTLEVLAERIKAMDGKLDRVVYAVEGNGQPGLKVRVDRLEQAAKQRKAIHRAVWTLVVALVGDIALRLL